MEWANTRREMIGYFAIFCCFLAVLQIVARLSLGRHSSRHIYLLITLALLAYILYFGGTLIAMTVFPPPAGLHWHLPVLFALGPAIHYFLKFSLLPDEDVPWQVLLLQWLPAALCLAFVASPLYPQRELTLIDLLKQFPGKKHDTHDAVAMIAFAVNTAYYVVNAYRTRFIFRLQRAELSGIILYIVIFQVGSIVTPVIAFVAMWVHSIDLLIVSCGLIAASILFGYVASIRYPEFFAPLQEQARQEKYRNSQLKGVNTKALDDKLDILLKEEKVFLNDRLSVKALSQLMQITPHQLSEYINVRFQKNFSSLMNEYRVAEAKRQLLADPGLSVIEIAFASGFGTKSNFNSVFLKATGMSPQQFRRANSP